MAEMLIQSESLTAIADEIRNLSGTENTMSLSVMEGHINEANTNIATQTDLIAQIKSTVNNLPEASSGSESVSYDTCTVNISTNGTIYKVAYLTVNDGVIDFCFDNMISSTKTITCLCGSYIALCVNDHVQSTCFNATASGFLKTIRDRIYHITAPKDEIASIHIETQQAGGND